MRAPWPLPGIDVLELSSCVHYLKIISTVLKNNKHLELICLNYKKTKMKKKMALKVQQTNSP